ncbi:TetR/AcrR family transcriptional regulator [Streptomyces libani]|uniref:TetR family transcriptional regulator n=2 Tax=Streptomyces nigrescens TaxID=1920 RepID=A0A640TAF2_STRNI|nr:MULTISPECIES: TetR/AcrR family transcriptional regulator [Streptomyces]MCX5446327.1 TetR/AcrR family transcriptional regulator [Streptomyces libani]WAT95136.1 TetR/AcrR family transcriptional regulator [Streptomyces libani subsp. libani]WAU02748.1 TetR/AcrR family transcriptional regulator [Streptomyces nigrescens]WDT59267.1 TetR/AcrR family transcriptional regulator [Streptomyces sp. G7(2002)]GFE20308.1 TetR family transcriptional regulator [Streptomyces libani subsp. libani]
MTPRRGDGPDEPTFTERARREQLIDATIDVISTRGYPATSLSAIAERAGLSKAAVLYHFSSKDKLTRAALEQVMEQFSAYVTERLARAAGPRDAIVAYVRAMIGYQQANRRQVRVITEMLLDDEGGTRLKTPGSHDTHGRWQGLADLLTEGQKAGVLREFDPRTVALAIGGAIDGVIAHWLAHPELDLDAAAAELEEFTLNAIERRS